MRRLREDWKENRLNFEHSQIGHRLNPAGERHSVIQESLGDALHFAKELLRHIFGVLGDGIQRRDESRAAICAPFHTFQRHGAGSKFPRRGCFYGFAPHFPRFDAVIGDASAGKLRCK